MRGKRSKQYRKLMQQYGLSFGFREPYQVLVDAEILKDADRFKMDLVGGLERTLHGKVKPMITQCSMRHLYAATNEPGMSFVIDKAKMYERRRCDHRPEDYPEPLSAKECLASVVDPKGAKTNKHRYVVASQELEVRKHMRGILGVPLVYINRSVMIMEPMAGATAEMREKEEKVKFRDGLKGRGSGSQGMKRKREDDGDDKETANDGADAAAKKKSKYGKGPKGPNPLSVKKSKKKADGEATAPEKKQDAEEAGDASTVAATADGSEPGSKKKRRRKHKSGNEGGDSEAVAASREGAEADMDVDAED
ncbi:putative rRNA-processing protein UTP23 [Coleophoma cylindrospora]|uniref:U three protein 23 n=1 Tax=Coleophoma cylindrospora TaxID=1849047 RepID=A0A3D8R1C9_9HELO|nr:putative rRNA-processing protein UTP23 [Coleophoma cylindrospora]